MATPVLLPKQGNSVESSLIARWHKKVGDVVKQGDVLCEIETDKALVEVESPAEGVMLARFFDEDALVPVMTTIAVIGQSGESVEAFLPSNISTQPTAPTPQPPAVTQAPQRTPTPTDTPRGVSPRARGLADARGIDPQTLVGTGPEGRVIERDVLAALNAPSMTNAAREMATALGVTPPTQGSGIGGRITTEDIRAQAAASAAVSPKPEAQPAELPVPDDAPHAVIPMRGVRKVTAERMLASLQNTAQLTLNSSADARALQAYRKRLKSSEPALGLQGITINDLVMFATVRALTQHPDLNATLSPDAITQHRRVHLGFAVDTPRGLLVPVIRDAHTRTLKQLADEARRLAESAQKSALTADDMQGGTFSVSNLGGLGIEHFTPVLNPPQVAILGVSAIQLKPIESGDKVVFVPHIGLSLTIDHQAVDGAPGARFLQTLARYLAHIDLMLAG